MCLLLCWFALVCFGFGLVLIVLFWLVCFAVSCVLSTSECACVCVRVLARVRVGTFCVAPPKKNVLFGVLVVFYCIL